MLLRALVSCTLCALAVAIPCARAVPAILNNASYAKDGALNRAIAQGSVFTIFGSGLGPATIAQVQTYPLPTDLVGTSVKVSILGRTVVAYPLYVTDGQVGPFLPSSALGSGTLTVTYQGQTSAPEPITIASLGLRRDAHAHVERAECDLDCIGDSDPIHRPGLGGWIHYSDHWRTWRVCTVSILPFTFLVEDLRRLHLWRAE